MVSIEDWDFQFAFHSGTGIIDGGKTFLYIFFNNYLISFGNSIGL